MIDKSKPISKKCKGCGVDRALEQFSVYQDGRLSMFCSTCEFDVDADFQSSEVKAMSRRERQVISSVISNLSNRNGISSRVHIDAPHVSELFASISRKIGGVDQLGDMFHQHMTALMAKDAASPNVTRAFQFIGNLAKYSTDTRDTGPDTVNLTDGELKAELERVIAAKLKEKALIPEDPENFDDVDYDDYYNK